MKHDYVVIGAGVSGMTAAVLLAKAGHSVALVEKAPRLAPLISGFRRNGLYFDTGLHYVGGSGKGQILDVLMRYLGIADDIETFAATPDNFELFRISKPRLDFTSAYGRQHFKTRLKMAFPAEKAAVDRYMNDIQSAYEMLMNFRFNEILIPFKIGDHRHFFSLENYVDDITADPAFKAVLTAHCFLHGGAPKEVSFLFHALVVCSYMASAYRIRGGGETLVNAYQKRLRKLGVDILLGNGAKEILFSAEPRPRAVRLDDDKTLVCDGCFSTVHPGVFLKLIPASLFRPVYRKRLINLEETPSAYMLFAEYEGRFGDALPPNLLGVSESGCFKWGTGDPIARRPLFLSGDPSAAKNGKTPVSIIVPAGTETVFQWKNTVPGHRSREYHLYKKKLTKDIFSKIKTWFPEISSRLNIINSATPLTLMDYTHSPYGSLYGVKHKIGQYNPFPRTQVSNLFLAGQATAAPGILGAMVSAYLAVGYILGDGETAGALEHLKRLSQNT